MLCRSHPCLGVDLGLGYAVASEGGCGCGLALQRLPGLIGECRQTIEISTLRVQVTEYHRVIVARGCHCNSAARFPWESRPYAGYGPNLKAYAVGLVEGHSVGNPGDRQKGR